MSFGQLNPDQRKEAENLLKQALEDEEAGLQMMAELIILRATTIHAVDILTGGRPSSDTIGDLYALLTA